MRPVLQETHDTSYKVVKVKVDGMSTESLDEDIPIKASITEETKHFS